LITLSTFPDRVEVSTNHIRHTQCFSSWKTTIKKLSKHVQSTFMQPESHKSVHTATYRYNICSNKGIYSQFYIFSSTNI